MDPHAVRPGTSDALFARTIDATVHPPLVRAQETVVAFVPRVAEAAKPFTSPLFLGALLIMTLSSFHPMQKPEPRQFADSRRPRTTIGAARVAYHPRYVPPPPPVPTPDIDIGVDPVEVYIPRDFAERLPDWSRDALENAERMMRDNERVRQMVQELRYRLREQARRERMRQLADRSRSHLRGFDLIDSP
jgi:hypothetical protein